LTSSERCGNINYTPSNRLGEVIEDMSIITIDADKVLTYFEAEYQREMDTEEALTMIRTNNSLPGKFADRIARGAFDNVKGDGLCGFHSLYHIIVRRFSKSQLYREDGFKETLLKALQVVNQKKDWFVESTLVIVARFLRVPLVIINEKNDIIYGTLMEETEVIKNIGGYHYVPCRNTVWL
jgi:hypothetical protein